MELKPDFGEASEEFWVANRMDPLSSEELAVLQMVDTLKKIPVIRFYSEGLKFFATGFLPVGKIDLGPWTEFGNYNNVEGLRGGFGLRTNYKFSKKWAFQGYLAYGFTDQRFKYSVSAKNILDRKHWTTLELKSTREIDQVGLGDGILGGKFHIPGSKPIWDTEKALYQYLAAVEFLIGSFSRDFFFVPELEELSLIRFLILTL